MTSSQHSAIKATELRPGDVIRIGASENYILAFEIIRTGNEIAVWAADGSKKALHGPSLRFKASAKAQVSRRDLRPWEV
jgi:hypothetical protein